MGNEQSNPAASPRIEAARPRLAAVEQVNEWGW